jgi:hypothetical protein
MSDSTNEVSPTEPMEPVEVPVAEQPAVAAEPVPVYAAAPSVAPAGPSRSTESRVVLAAGLAVLALVLAAGVFAAGIAVGSHSSRFGRTANFGPAMMQDQGYGRGFDGQTPGRGMMPGQGYSDQNQSYRRGGRGMVPGQGYGRGFRGQGSISPTAYVPAAPGQW